MELKAAEKNTFEKFWLSKHSQRQDCPPKKSNSVSVPQHVLYYVQATKKQPYSLWQERSVKTDNLVFIVITAMIVAKPLLCVSYCNRDRKGAITFAKYLFQLKPQHSSSLPDSPTFFWA